MSDSEDRERSRDRDRSRRDRSNRISESSRDRSPDRGKDRGGMNLTSCRVYVSNVPYEYKWQDLKDLFRTQVGDVSFVELFVDENEKPRGCGIVEFSDANSVKKCLDVMHRFELKGRKLVIKEDLGNQRDKYGNIIGSAASKRAREREDNRDRRVRDDRRSAYEPTRGFEQMVNMQVNNRSLNESSDRWGNTYGLSPQFLESLWINSPLLNRVFVANLDYKVTKKKLKEVFRLAGKVQRVDLSVDKDGNSRGFAVIEYDHPVEAVQAISMFHNQTLYDRTMMVRMDRDDDKQLKIPDGLKAVGMGLGLNGEPLKDVAKNLPSIAANPPTPVANPGAGILGAVPNTLGLGSSALGNAAMLQAANLAGVGGLSSNLLANSLGSGDMGLASLVQQNPSLAALANSASSVGFRNDTSAAFMTNNPVNNFQSSNMSQNQSYNTNNRTLQTGGNYDSQKIPSLFGNFNSNNRERDNRQANSNLYSSVNNGAQMIRQNTNTQVKNEDFSNKILISNLPPTASYKLLSEKCNEFGNVQGMENKGAGTVLVNYSTEWEADRAMKNLDRARIDGRTIDVRFYY